jgi:hypothetical protein
MALSGPIGSGAVRALRATDIGVKGLEAFDATLSVVGGKATVFVNYMEGNLGLSGLLGVERALKGIAAAEGASVLRVEARLANEKLYDALVRRYGLRTAGGVDFFEVPIK